MGRRRQHGGRRTSPGASGPTGAGRVGDRLDIMLHRSVDVGKRADGAIGFWPAARADGRGTFRATAPAAFQFVQGGIELAPLAAREKAPLQRILKTRVILAGAPPGNLRSCAPNCRTIEDRM